MAEQYPVQSKELLLINGVVGLKKIIAIRRHSFMTLIHEHLAGFE